MKLLSVVKKDLRLLLRDRGQMISLFLLPLAFIVPISLAFPKDGYNLQSDFKPRMPVVNQDVAGAEAETDHAQALVDFLAEGFDVEQSFGPQTVARLELEAEPSCAQAGLACDEAVVRALLERSERETAVIIPAGFSAAVEAGEHVTVTLLYDPAGDAIRRQINEAVLAGGTTQLSIQNQVFGGFGQLEDLLTFAPESVQESINAQIESQEAAEADEESAGVTTNPALSVVTVDPSSFELAQRPDTYQQTVPGYTVMYVFFLISFLSAALRAERNEGTFRRLLHTPVSRSQILGGKVAAALVVGSLQVLIMFSVGHFAFGMGLGNAPLALVVLTLSVVLAAVGLGLAAAAFNLENVLSIPLIVTALIGGCMFPVDWLPPFIRTVGYAIPHTWAMSGYQDILVRGRGLLEIVPAVGVLLGFAVIFFSLAVRRLDFE